MILRRVIDHFRKQEWTAIFLDFVIVVAGVFVGMQVNNWNDGRAEQRRADALYAQIAEDLEGERVGIKAAIDYYTVTIRNAQTAIDGYETPGTISDNAFVIAAYQASQWLDPVTSRSTYDELLATGAIRLIRNETARARLIGYFEFDWTEAPAMRTRPAYRERLRGVMPFPVQQAIIEACGDRNVVTDRTFISELPAVCPLELEPAQAAAAADALRASPGLEESLRYQLAENTSKVGTMRSILEQLGDLAESMKEDVP